MMNGGSSRASVTITDRDKPTASLPPVDNKEANARKVGRKRRCGQRGRTGPLMTYLGALLTIVAMQATAIVALMIRTHDAAMPSEGCERARRGFG